MSEQVNPTDILHQHNPFGRGNYVDANEPMTTDQEAPAPSILESIQSKYDKNLPKIFKYKIDKNNTPRSK